MAHAVDVTADRLLGLGSRLEDGAPDQLGFLGLEEGLDHRVIITVPFPGHRDLDAELPQLGLILNRTILDGFKRSSQHPERGGCDEHSKAAIGSVWARPATVARPATDGGT
jgi:hypothetical protein